MGDNSSSNGFKWELSRSTGFGVWKIQFRAHLLSKALLHWLTHEPDPAVESQTTQDASCMAQIILAMKDGALIRMSEGCSTAKAYWDLLVKDFEGRIQIRKHEIVKEERDLCQKKHESFVDYCDRAAELRSRMATAGVHDGNLADHFILGLSQPFQQNNAQKLTSISHDHDSMRFGHMYVSILASIQRLIVVVRLPLVPSLGSLRANAITVTNQVTKL